MTERERPILDCYKNNTKEILANTESGMYAIQTPWMRYIAYWDSSQLRILLGASIGEGSLKYKSSADFAVNYNDFFEEAQGIIKKIKNAAGPSKKLRIASFLEHLFGSSIEEEINWVNKVIDSIDINCNDFLPFVEALKFRGTHSSVDKEKITGESGLIWERPGIFELAAAAYSSKFHNIYQGLEVLESDLVVLDEIITYFSDRAHSTPVKLKKARGEELEKFGSTTGAGELSVSSRGSLRRLLAQFSRYSKMPIIIIWDKNTDKLFAFQNPAFRFAEDELKPVDPRPEKIVKTGENALSVLPVGKQELENIASRFFHTEGEVTAKSLGIRGRRKAAILKLVGICISTAMRRFNIYKGEVNFLVEVDTFLDSLNTLIEPKIIKSRLRFILGNYPVARLLKSRGICVTAEVIDEIEYLRVQVK